jgi:putative ABC transport system permease protein
MLRLAIRNISRQKLRTAMTLTAIVFGVAGLVLSGGFVRDIFLQLGEALIHSQSGHIQIARTGFFTYGSRSPEKYVIEDADRLRSEIAAVVGVEDVLARAHLSGLLNNGKTDWPVVGEGVEPSKEAKLSTLLRIVNGRQLTDKDAYGALVGQGVAKALNLTPGDRITLLISTSEGAVNNMDLEVTGIFQSFSKDYDARAIRLPLAAAQEALASKRVNTLVVSLKKTSDTEHVAAQLRSLLGNGSHELKTWTELNDFYEKTVDLYDRQFSILQFVVLAMVLLSVLNTVNMNVFERIGEFGTMRALGDRGRRIFSLVLTESILLGVIGSALGVATGCLLALAISAIGIPMPPPPNANLGYTAFIQILPEVVLMAFVVGVVGTAMAAVWPAVRVSRMPVADALRANI